MSRPEGVPPEGVERVPGGPVGSGTEPKQPEVNRAEQIFEEAAKRVATGDPADLDTALRQYHNQVVAETGDDRYSFDDFSNDVIERADSMLNPLPTEAETTPVASPAVSPEQASEPESAINPAEHIMQTAAQELATGRMDETKLQDYQTQAQAAGLPGNDLGIFATEIANRANAIRASQRPAEATPASPVAEQAVTEPEPEFASLGAAGAAKEAKPRWTVPQPAADPLLRRGDGTFRTVSAEERGKAEQQYINTRTQIEATQARLESKYARLPKAQREERIRADKEMQPLLREFDRVKDVLTSVVKEKPVSTPKAEKPARQRREKPTPTSTEPTPALADQEPSPTPVAPQPKTAPEEPGVLSVSGDILGGMSSPETRAAAARLASETPPGPLRDQLERAASEPTVVPAAPMTPNMAARLTRHLRVEPTAETPPAKSPTAEPKPAGKPVMPVSAVPENERADAARLEKLGRTVAETLHPERVIPEEKTAPDVVPVTTETSSQPETGPASPESGQEKEPLPHEQAVIDARMAYRRALLNERRWFNFGNKKELARSLKGYREAKDFAVRVEAKKLKAEYPTAIEELDEKGQAEYTSRLVELATKYHVEEEGQLRDSLIQPGQRDWVERSRQFMRRHWKARLALGVPLGMAGLGVFVSGVAWAQNIEALLRGGQKIFDQRWGKSQHLTADQVGKIDTLDAAAGRLAATTFDELEYGPEKTKNSKEKKGSATVITETPSRAKTREMLHQRYGELLRQQRETDAHESLKRGESLESVAEKVLQESLDGALGGGRTLHQAYLERIHRNKNLSKLRVVASVAGGAVTGVVMNEAVHHLAKSEAVQNAREWFGGLFKHTPDVQAGHPGGSLGDAYRDVADATRTPNWAGIERPVDGVGLHPGLEQAAAETATVSAIETARPGDSVWTMAERYIGEQAAGLTEEQKTWLIDSVKDAVAKDPARFGLENIDRIAVGQTVDFSQAGLNLDSLTSQAKHLSAATLESIHQNLTEKATEEATQAAVTTSAPVSPTGQYFPADADNSEYFAPAAETVTPAATPAVEHVVAAPAAETISQQIPETLAVTPDVIRDFDTYRTVALNVPETAMGQFRQSLESITLQRGLEIGPIENALRGLPDVNNTQEELMSTALHKLAKSLIGAGHAPNQSMAAGLEWIRVSRQ